MDILISQIREPRQPQGTTYKINFPMQSMENSTVMTNANKLGMN